MAELAIALLFLSMLLVLIRAIRGPSVPDRILAANAFGTVTVVWVAALAVWGDRLAFLDIALTYALINFILTVALLKAFHYGRLDAVMDATSHPAGHARTTTSRRKKRHAG